MAKKKKSKKASNKEFGSNPFSDLKGLSVSVPVPSPPEDETQKKPTIIEHGSFANEMEKLGVKKIHPDDASVVEDPAGDSFEEATQESPQQSDDEVFLQAMGDLQVDFKDNFPEPAQKPKTAARRMKQLKQGRLVTQATLDLHGLTRADVAEKLTFFLQDASHQGWQTVLVITGKGLHSAAGEPVLRTEAERYLLDEGRTWVVEWGRAPQNYGGDGALVLFLRKNT